MIMAHIRGGRPRVSRMIVVEWAWSVRHGMGPLGSL